MDSTCLIFLLNVLREQSRSIWLQYLLKRAGPLMWKYLTGWSFVGVYILKSLWQGWRSNTNNEASAGASFSMMIVSGGVIQGGQRMGLIAHFATSVQKGCMWENRNLRKTIFIVQPHKGNNPNILLETVTTFEQAYGIPMSSYNLWALNHIHLQPFSA